MQPFNSSGKYLPVIALMNSLIFTTGSHAGEPAEDLHGSCWTPTKLTGECHKDALISIAEASYYVMPFLSINVNLNINTIVIDVHKMNAQLAMKDCILF